MKKFILLFLLGASGSLLFGQNGNHQPYCDYWYPDSLLNWTPASDSASPFNKGRVPLAARFIDTLSSPCPVSKSPNVKLACLSVTNSTTSKNPSQGYDIAGEYAFGFWQYVDYFVMWGGSAGEGLILAPNSTWIDAGHRGGTKVMGTIFFPPTVYGGQIQWVNDLTQSTGGVYPVADKLIQMANYYGFDGFFINQETGGGSGATGTAIEGFMAYFQAHKTANMEIMWYDAMVPSGAINYQNALDAADAPMFENGTTLESNSIFLNYNWSNNGLTNSKNEAVTLGRSPFDVYAGIDVSSNGYNTGVAWNDIFPTVNTPKVSVGLFEPSWTFHSSPSPNDIPLFYQREEEFWVGANNSPCNVPGSGWPGLSKYYIEKSVISSWPFITNFNTGQGTNGCWIGGNQVSTKPWNNQSDQDALPTWRWVTQSAGTPLSINWDFTQAYNGGNSLLVSGALSSSNTTTIPLYNTKLPVTASSNLSITFKTGTVGPSDMQVAVAFTNAPGTLIYLNCGNTLTSGWNTVSLPLSTYAGDTLCIVGLQFASSTPVSYAMNVGQIALTNATVPASAAPTNLSLTTYTNCTNAELKVYYDTSVSNNIWYYDIYRVTPYGANEWLGRTPDNAYYVKNIKRIDNEVSTTISVVAVNSSGISSTPLTQSFTWPANPTNLAMSLNGTNQYFNRGIANLSGNAITLEGWVNVDSFKSQSPFVSGVLGIDDTAQNTALLRIGNTTIANNKVQLALNVGGSIQTLTSATALTAATWYHIAGTYDGSNMAIYINGVQDAQMAASGAVKAQGHFYIGRDSAASAVSYLAGMVDELRAWTVARAGSDIAADKCNVSDTTTGLAAYWTFNDCTVDTTAYDNSPNNNDAAGQNVTAANWVTTVPCAPAGLADVRDMQSVKFYPNPVLNGATAILEIPANTKADCYVYDETGNLLLKQTTDQPLTDVNIDRVSAGIYLYRVVTSNQTFTGKLVIIR